MANLKKLKEKISSFSKTAKVTKAMESISAIKMRKAQQEAVEARFYSFKVFGILKRLSHIVGENVDSIFANSIPDDGRVAILLITPDKGLTGGMNTFLNKKVLEVVKENNFSKDNLDFICVGKKGYEFLERNNFSIIKYFDQINEKSDLKVVSEVSDYVSDLYKNKVGEYKKIFSIYTEFINTSEQKAVSKIILPVVFDNVKDFVKTIKPNKGKYSNLKNIEIDDKDVPAYIFEPNIETVLHNLIPYILNIEVYYSLLESFASEHSARMVAMKNATEKAEEKAEDSRKKFNRQRQAKITQEISEIVSGMESMK